MGIFNFFGSILGYVLWAAWFLVKNFGLAIIIFTIITKIVMFPFSLKQQKQMAKNARMQKKQQELREKYANNKQKLNEEMQKLYQREGMSMGGGCLTSIIPMFIMLGIFYAVAYPLTNMMHLNPESISQATNYLNTIPGFVSTASSTYSEISLVEVFPKIADTSFITGLFSPSEIQSILDFSNSFNFFGFNMLTTPSSLGIFSWYIIIPVLCFVTSIASQVITMRINGSTQQMQGCMKIMIYVLPLFSAWIAFSVPAAVGFYWIMSYVITLVQSIILGKFFNPVSIVAKEEAQHVALLELKEAQVPRIYAPVNNNSADKSNGKKKKK